jgi:hypothetical protein
MSWRFAWSFLPLLFGAAIALSVFHTHRKGVALQRAYLGARGRPLRRPVWEGLLAGALGAAATSSLLELQGGGIYPQTTWAGLELWALWDVSLSMRAVDARADGRKVSRLDWCRSFLNQAPDELRDARLALVPFAGQATLAFEPTGDAEQWRYYLEHASELAPERGTDLLAPFLLLRDAWQNRRSSEGHPLLLLLSDGGKEPGMEPSEALLQETLKALLAQRPHLTVLCLAVGEEVPVPIPREAESGEQWERDPVTGQPLYTALWLPPLRSAAEAARGKVIRVGSQSPSWAWEQVRRELLERGIRPQVRWSSGKEGQGEGWVILWAVLGSLVLAFFWM